MTPRLSVIIPALEEADHLPRALAALAGNECPHEILVVDAGSADGTPGLAARIGARVLSAEPSRPAQMNLGARESSAPLLLFLHADTLLPNGALDRLVAAFEADPALAGGAFTRRFESASLLLRLTTRLADLRSKYLGLFLGDQGIFLRREHFDALRGFDESLPNCEDLDLSRRLRKRGKTIALGPPVLTSARRFAARGPLRTTLADLQHAWRYFAS